MSAESSEKDDADWEAEVARAERGAPGIRRWLAYQDRKARKAEMRTPSGDRA